MPKDWLKKQVVLNITMVMPATIITIAQHKGGAGKTTLTTQLAVAISAEGHKILVIDADPQGSTTAWHNVRARELGRKNKIDLNSALGWKLLRDMPNFVKDYDYILIDTPPHAESEASTAIRLSHLVLMPVQPSPLDVWACAPTIKLILNEKKPVMLVLNRVPATSKLNGAIMDKLSDMKIMVAKQTLGNRVSFASSIMKGLGVIEQDPRSVAAHEILSLWGHVKSTLHPRTASTQKRA
jgi:chromosome partitioning protein